MIPLLSYLKPSSHPQPESQELLCRKTQRGTRPSRLGGKLTKRKPIRIRLSNEKSLNIFWHEDELPKGTRKKEVARGNTGCP